MASGWGSNLESIINSQKKGIISSRVALVISNNSNSNALNIARINQIPAVHLSRLRFDSDGEYASEFLNLLKKYNIELIVLAGYLKLLPQVVVHTYKNRILNIHPALLPQFGGKGMYGMFVHEAVIKKGEKFSGATVHLVDEHYDTGPIVLQEKVEVSSDDTPETLQKKVLKIEHKILPEAIKLYETKTPVITGREVKFT
ncbi:MAG: phosphoribosylglycinamide formyltransferase [Ignavibacteriae bacterium]|nr:MAG: phosphoribosylglycinamide formyltransferase [Ignavibacteriota bacterium]